MLHPGPVLPPHRPDRSSVTHHQSSGGALARGTADERLQVVQAALPPLGLRVSRALATSLISAGAPPRARLVGLSALLLRLRVALQGGRCPSRSVALGPDRTLADVCAVTLGKVWAPSNCGHSAGRARPARRTGRPLPRCGRPRLARGAGASPHRVGFGAGHGRPPYARGTTEPTPDMGQLSGLEQPVGWACARSSGRRSVQTTGTKRARGGDASVT